MIFFSRKKIKIKKIINCKFQDNCVYVNWKNWVICRIRPNNYIMCERLGNFWCLHQYLYSAKRLRCFTSDYRVRMFSCSRAATIVWAMGKTKLKMKHHKHLLSVCCTVKIMLSDECFVAIFLSMLLLWWVFLWCNRRCLLSNFFIILLLTLWHGHKKNLISSIWLRFYIDGKF